MDDSYNEHEKKVKQVENLENLVENYTRTERHLEQYSDIGDPKYKDMARKKQKIREEQIDYLKSHLTGEKDKMTSEEHLEHLENNYEDTIEYVKNNFHNIDDEHLINMSKKQANRREQMLNLTDPDYKDEMF